MCLLRGRSARGPGSLAVVVGRPVSYRRPMELADWCMWFKRRGAGRLRHLLMRHWDPIGVAGLPEARDEYDSYLGLICDRLRTGSSVIAIRELLEGIRTQQMGLNPGGDRSLPAARIVVDWYGGEMARAEKTVSEAGASYRREAEPT